MSETNNLNQNPNSDNQSVNQTEINNQGNHDEGKPDNPTNLSPSVSEQKEQSQATPKSQNIDWHRLAHKLREHNRKLLKKVFQLEQEIAETNNRIQEHQLRSQSTDLLIAQQAEEINHAQEDTAHVIQELESAKQEVHGQKILVDNLTKQLETTNEKFTQLESKYALLQEKYNEKNHDLLMKTQQVQELSDRLSRQQRYTLQYKAALDKYREVASSGKIPKTNLDRDLLQTQPQPIKAWSQTQTSKETSTIKSSNLGLNKEIYPLESELKLTSKKSKETNWPSPVITSTNSQKKPKSLAAVELPKFQNADADNGS
ncbi:MAG: hypothetical protein QNJ34_02955 [Xenococcaceae cyanobacterium MO_188.B29]|nr:hypothetical protein [Xenococcaceae cyanobacterium MO_188.B29]